MCRFVRISLVCISIGLATSSASASDNDLEQLKQELQQMREAYEGRIQKLEARIADLDAAQRSLPDNSTASVAVAGPGQGQNAFNPGISATLNGKLSSYSRDPAGYALPGFQLGSEAGLSAEGLSAEESEISISGNIDDRFFASLTLGVHLEDGETATELEEAYIESMGLDGGFGVKAGRFFSEVGYLNRQHSHAWDFADEPLVYRAFLGRQYADEGVQVRWLAPTDTFLELGGEYLRGAGFPAGGAGNEGKGVYSLFAHLGGDVGVSHSWRVGLSGLSADTPERSGGEQPSVFAGDSDLWIADLVWKWAPNGNPTERNFKFQAEYFQRREDGTISLDDGARLTDYRGTQRGWYAQGVYQFQPRWRIGARYDLLQSDNRGSDQAVLDDAGLNDGYDPTRFSLMLDYSRNEFNRVRFQYNQDESRPGNTDNQFTIQYIMSFGAHGGHQF